MLMVYENPEEIQRFWSMQDTPNSERWRMAVYRGSHLHDKKEIPKTSDCMSSDSR